MKNNLILVVVIFLSIALFSSCAQRDCQGNKHKIKTGMGGYL